MSLILDALKRAERDRRAEPMSGVDVPTLAPPRRRRWWLRILLGIVLAFVVLLVVAVAVHVAKARRAAAPPPAAPPATARVPPPKPHLPVQAPPDTGSLVAQPAAPAPRAIPGTESVSSLDELAEPEPAPPPVTSSAAPITRAPPKPAAQSAPHPAPAPQPDSAPQPAPAAPAPAAASEGEVPGALTQPAPLRKLREMPPEFRADFPPINLQVHVYEKDPAARFIIVSDRRYHEGENLAEGPKVVEIVREGVVVEFRGEKLLYSLNR